MPTRYFIQEIKANIRSVINAEGRALEARCKDLGAEVSFVEESRQITLNGAVVSLAVAPRLAENAEEEALGVAVGRLLRSA